MSLKGKIVILGAGKSSSYLIKYLSDWSVKHRVEILIADLFPAALTKAKAIVNNKARCKFILLNESDQSIDNIIKDGYLVISLLPVTQHYAVAKACLKHRKHLLTASYISPEMQSLDADIKNEGLTFLFECGLDPGIDHMSAFDLLQRIHDRGEKVISFVSATGGLVDPACEGDNPWAYKFTWNPRNVVLAGKGTAVFKENDLIKEIPYEKLFTSARPLSWSGKEELEYYPNRDSFKYQELYKLPLVQTFIRGTIRRRGYSEAWNVMVQLGMTDDENVLEGVSSYATFLSHFIKGDWVKKHLEEQIGLSVSNDVWNKIQFLELNSEKPLMTEPKTAAAYLQVILEEKWALEENDKDWVLMQHRIKTVKDKVEKEYSSTLSVKGVNNIYTAMAKTVGLPLAMAAICVYNDTWKKAGINIPDDPLLYKQILSQLSEEGVSFVEEENYK